MTVTLQPISTLPTAQEVRGLLPGAAGMLEALITPSPSTDSTLPYAIICHPHPLFDGTMDNKVVTTTARACRDKGLSVIRFNFRGVGLSAGQYGETVGECEDLLAVINWLSEQIGSQPPLILAGFSFGSYIAAKVANQQESCQHLISIAPPVHHFDFDNLAEPPCPWHVIQGELDEIVPPESVYDFCQRRPYIDLIRLPETSHFFHRQLITLKTQLLRLL